ncbi:sperm acrosome developmental regulator [Dasypus novemcinctus]|uniref:sperm acrosome developmental regulator n=1 Tax=Dasypus novemcinctus TaxID=9361 RepID=UPI002660451B|nr:sperm acrosome developmental regulator [Dasypus novemcinctus]
MTGFLGFFRWVWRKITCWVLFWRHRAKPTTLGHPGSTKHVKRVEKPLKVVEAKDLKLDEPPDVGEPCLVVSPAEGTQLELGQEAHSLLQLPRTAVQSVSTLMVSALQTGWQMCPWKSPESSASIPSQMTTRSPLESPEAEMLREVYLVLWAIRKQLRQLARRQERRRRRHARAHASPQPAPAQGPKQDARSPL